MLKKMFVLVMAMMLIFTMTAYAAEPAGTEIKDQNAGTKLARGSMNLLGFFLELPKQIYLTSKQENAYIGLTYGFVKGLGYGAYRLADGVFETVTCVIPPYDKILVEPEYVFQGWD